MKTTQAILLALTATAYGRVGRLERRAAFGGNSNNGDACIAAQALADGIQSNVDLQRGEAASLAKVKTVVSQQNIDQSAFTAAKQQLLDFVNAGISVRQNNQAIAPSGNGAVAGLAIVQQAQATELQLSTSLQGNANDLATISQLEQDFSGGTAQNEQNAINAVQGCSQVVSQLKSENKQDASNDNAKNAPGNKPSNTTANANGNNAAAAAAAAGGSTLG